MRPKASDDGGRSQGPGLGLGLSMADQQPASSAPWEVVTGSRSRSSSSSSSDPVDSVWSRLFRHLTIQRPMMHRLLVRALCEVALAVCS